MTEFLKTALSRILGTREDGAKPSVEEAIAAWENNNKRNPEGYKIVRGFDGRPVEVVLVKRGKEPVFAVVVNGEQEQFQIAGEMKPIEQVFRDLRFQQFLHANVFDGWYELEGVQRLDAQVGRNHQGFVFGLPGPQPEELKMGFRAV